MTNEEWKVGATRGGVIYLEIMVVREQHQQKEKIYPPRETLLTLISVWLALLLNQLQRENKMS